VVETPTKRPLDGVRVIDLSNYVSGPFAGMMLADLGADVIKVEQPQGGDPTRRIGRRLEGGVSGLFFNTNRNKRSIALDLKAPATCPCCSIWSTKVTYSSRIGVRASPIDSV